MGDGKVHVGQYSSIMGRFAEPAVSGHVAPHVASKISVARRAKAKKRVLELATTSKSAVDEVIDQMSDAAFLIAERALDADTKESRFADYKRASQKDTRGPTELVRDTASLKGVTHVERAANLRQHGGRIGIHKEVRDMEVTESILRGQDGQIGVERQGDASSTLWSDRQSNAGTWSPPPPPKSVEEIIGDALGAAINAKLAAAARPGIDFDLDRLAAAIREKLAE